jgi:hypothetical protein
MYAIVMPLCGKIFLPSLMKVGEGVRGMLISYLKYLSGTHWILGRVGPRARIFIVPALELRLFGRPTRSWVDLGVSVVIIYVDVL